MLGHSLHFYVLEMKDWLSLSPISPCLFWMEIRLKASIFPSVTPHESNNSSPLSFTSSSGDKMLAIGSDFAGHTPTDNSRRFKTNV